MIDLNTPIEAPDVVSTETIQSHGLPWAGICAALALLGGIGLGVAGIYLIAGAGWALISSSVPLLLLAAIIIRGLLRG